MRSLTALAATITALVLGAGALIAPPAAAATLDDDVDTIVSRLQDYYLGQGDDIIIANGIFLARASEAQEYAASQNEDGSWADVNYADRTSSANGSTWSAYIALYRMLAMAQAYRSPDAPGFEDPELIAALDRALVHWDRVDPGNQNWWETEIGESMVMGRIAVFVGDELSGEAFDAAQEHNTGKLDPVGANGAWRTTNYLFEAVSTRNFEDITAGFATMVETVEVDESGDVNEAVQPDASFWAHEAQLYSEGYGMALFTNVAIWADAARGTSLGFTREQLDTIAFYIINGTRWMIRGEVGMLYLGYRPPKTVDGVTGYAAEFLEPLDQMVRTDALYATAYRDLAANIRGQAVGNGVTGNKYFWRSEFSSQLRDDYGIFTRLNSSRTVGAEYRSTFRPAVGNEVYWNSAGATAIQVTGREYLELGPAFDWFHYPGVTAPYVKEQTRGTNGRVGNGGSFTGGVSDGTYGASVYTLDRSSSKASKSYYYFDDEMVALGAGIRSTSDGAVHTVVNQASAKPNASVGGEAIEAGTADQPLDGARWAYNDQVGYVVPDDGSLRVSRQLQSGSWVGEDVVERDAFTLYFDHGVRPTDASYEYTVLPAAGPGEVAAYAAAPAVETLRNDASVQAVRHAGLERTMATFYEAGDLDLGDGRVLRVDQPAIVILDESGDSPVVSLANPDKPALLVRVDLIGAETSQRGTFALGSGAYLGQTVTAPLTNSEGGAASPFSASSTAAGSDAAFAGDGDAGTAWRSSEAGVQWLTADVGVGSFVTGVTIEWEDAAAERYLLQTSLDGRTWVDQRVVQDGDGGTDAVEFAPQAATYVRLLMLESVGDGSYGVAEFEVSSTRNIALGRSVTASGGSAIGSITDGNMATRWSSNLSDTAWTQVDLGSVQPIGAVRLWWEASYATRYRIQVSDDAASWRDVYTTPEAGSDGGVDVLEIDADARYVRMQASARSASQYGVSLWEFEVFPDDLIVSANAAPAGRENLALGKDTTADSQFSDALAAQYATDGNTTTRWASLRQNAPYTTPRWLQVDLGAERTVNQAVITWEAATSNDYRVQGSIDGATWSELARVQKTSAELRNVVDFADTEVRYVRVEGLPVTRYGMSIFELELYGGYNFASLTESVTVEADSTAVVAASITPLDGDDTFSAYPLDAAVATVDGDARVAADGRIEFDLTTGRSGSTSVLLLHANGDEPVWSSVSIAISTAELQRLVEQANALDSTRYTAESWQPLLPALEAAKELLRAPAGVSQETADARAAALRAAIDGLLVDEAPATPTLSVSGEVRAGSPISVVGTGFESGAEYVVQLRSTPVDLGAVIADAEGAFELRAAVPADVAPGEHTLVAMQGETDVASLVVTVAAAPSDGGTGGGSDGGAGGGSGGDPAGPPSTGDLDRDGELSATGGQIAGVMWAIGIAGALLVAGAAAVRGARRNRA
ncbi:discoidin domain-containing protein [Microbacterium sp. SMR1]|uniref:discoidin domain-containing protein n=1 Tax=Microbacterium sp. SMR1 TaxID=1497340 RepID=UPI000DCB1C78|nr:discoidin domain-containing protein [Microbacterium sp. SMR1]RAZ31399.1 hypothetical protein DO944_10640 [Microbacterium sp. SMR1]